MSSTSSSSISLSTSRPLVVLLDGRDCSVEMPLLKDVATVAFCDASNSYEIHDKVLDEAFGALMWHTISITREDLMRFRKLKVIVRIGSGVENVDIRAAGELGISVCNVPGCDVEETADSTLCFILNLFRRTSHMANIMLEGRHICGPEGVRQYARGAERIRGKCLGIVGLGRVGTAVALRAKVFGFTVQFFDPFLPDGIEQAMGLVRLYSLQELLATSDCVSLHCSLNEDNRTLINATSLKCMKPGAYLVNTSSAALVDVSALLNSLHGEPCLGGAALDVDLSAAQMSILTPEVLRRTPNLICTPRSAFFSEQSMRELREHAAHEMRRALTQRMPDALRNCVNREYLRSGTGTVNPQPRVKSRNSLAASPQVALEEPSITSTAGTQSTTLQSMLSALQGQQPSHPFMALQRPLMFSGQPSSLLPGLGSKPLPGSTAARFPFPLLANGPLGNSVGAANGGLSLPLSSPSLDLQAALMATMYNQHNGLPPTFFTTASSLSPSSIPMSTTTAATLTGLPSATASSNYPSKHGDQHASGTQNGQKRKRKHMMTTSNGHSGSHSQVENMPTPGGGGTAAVGDHQSAEQQ